MSTQSSIPPLIAKQQGRIVFATKLGIFFNQFMEHENQDEWAASAIVSQETIRVIVKSFARGPHRVAGDLAQGRYGRK